MLLVFFSSNLKTKSTAHFPILDQRFPNLNDLSVGHTLSEKKLLSAPSLLTTIFLKRTVNPTTAPKAASLNQFSNPRRLRSPPFWDKMAFQEPLNPHSAFCLWVSVLMHEYLQLYSQQCCSSNYVNTTL